MKTKLELTERELRDIEDGLEWSIELYKEDTKMGLKYVRGWLPRIKKLLRKVKAHIPHVTP